MFSRSISAIFSQLAIRLSVPSSLTTSGPRWSRRSAAPPTSSVDDEPSVAAGRAGSAGSGAGCEVDWDSGCVLLVFSVLISESSMVGDESGAREEGELVEECESRRELMDLGVNGDG